MNYLVLVALLAVALPALLIEARIVDSDAQIIGGRNARIGEFPWQGSLQRLSRRRTVEEYRGHTCGCVLVSDTWVVTAAHCVGAGARGLYVVMGLHRRGSSTVGKPVGYYISTIYSHPLWNRATLMNDIAMIRLQSRVEMNRYVRPVRMAEAGSNFDGLTCTISGWGVTSTGGGSLATTLQKADVQVMPEAQCRRIWRQVGPSHICVGVPNRRGSCNGDSGGPLVCYGRLAGVTSFGQRGCFTNTPSVYTRISAYRAWIKQVSGL